MQRMLLLFKAAWLIGSVVGLLSLLNIAQASLINLEIYKAIDKGDLKEVTRLLDAGEANVDEPNPVMMTPLFRAVTKNRVEIVALLLKRGADVNFRDDLDSTPLMCAVTYLHKYHSLKMVQLLLDNGASVDIWDNTGTTAMRYAISYNEANAVALLLKYHADPNLQDSEGSTPLMSACWKNRKEMVHLLLKANADTTLKNKEGKTALYYAREHEYKDVVALLEKFGASE